jgi:hypothetical protein
MKEVMDASSRRAWHHGLVIAGLTRNPGGHGCRIKSGMTHSFSFS